MKNYRAQTPQNLALSKILQNFRKTSTPLKKGANFRINYHELWQPTKSVNVNPVTKLINIKFQMTFICALRCARFHEILQNFSEGQIFWSLCSVDFLAFNIEISCSNFTFCGTLTPSLCTFRWKMSKFQQNEHYPCMMERDIIYWLPLSELNNQTKMSINLYVHLEGNKLVELNFRFRITGNTKTFHRTTVQVLG